VGGFNQSERLQKAITKHFKENVKIIIPSECNLAVVKGAVLFGHDPTIIHSRVSDKTYGVETCPIFNPSCHHVSKKSRIGDKNICKDVYTKFVSKGQHIPIGYSQTLIFNPVHKEQDKAEVVIYSSEMSDAQYITDEGVKRHCSIYVDWAGTGLDRELKVTMTFGGTEIHVCAVSYPGENQQLTTINFYKSDEQI
jgi:hypothetical protein